MIELNFAGIAVATVNGMVLGASWYSPLLFGNAWMKSIGKTPEMPGKPTGLMISSVFARLLLAVGVSLLFAVMDVSSLPMALGVCDPGASCYFSSAVVRQLVLQLGC